eukprot:scaffold9290_cov63-Phaeocystis_antarctica.AAC.5
MHSMLLLQLPISLSFRSPSAAYFPVAPSIRSRSVAMFETETQLDISRESTPDDPNSAIGIMAELKANAALFAAFAFGSLNLPAPLIESTSKVILSQGITVTTAKPISESTLLQAFVLLDTATLCLMLVCVAASQLLIYRLADGSYGTIRFSTDDNVDRRDTPLGRLVNQYRAEVLLPHSPTLLYSPAPLLVSYSSPLTDVSYTLLGQFRIARVSFALGLSTLLLAVGVKSVTIFDEAIALPATALVGSAAFTIASLYLRSYGEVFRPLDQCDGFDECEASYMPQVPQVPALPTLPGAALGAAVGMAVAFSVMESDLKPGVQGRLGAPSSSSQPNAAERGILELSKDLTIVRDQLFPDPVPTP